MAAMSAQAKKRRLVTTPSGSCHAGSMRPATMEEHLDLMKAGGGIVEFVDQDGTTDGDGQAGFLKDFADQVCGQGRACVHTTPRRAPQIGLPARIGVDQEQAVILQDQGAGGKARRLHDLKLA
jgi:hypothetical protein